MRGGMVTCSVPDVGVDQYIPVPPSEPRSQRHGSRMPWKQASHGLDIEGEDKSPVGISHFEDFAYPNLISQELNGRRTLADGRRV